MSYQDLKARVANLRTQVATHKARVEQAEIQLREKEKAIQETYGMTPEQLTAALANAEVEIQDTGRQILSSLEAAGA